ncbi:unnamed protein product [Oikopleura dioica]|uniref:Uncharacterized protein n=1 Tax=Oikopleura dioica TaxID=34765 RepID=E4Y012_OIKDI|nr:unnamed protein product [Oikopleura dioica]
MKNTKNHLKTRKQYEIEHKRDSFKKKTHVDYRISRSAAGLNHPVKIGSTSEVTISASDVFNFNGYVAKHMPNTARMATDTPKLVSGFVGFQSLKIFDVGFCRFLSGFCRIFVGFL